MASSLRQTYEISDADNLHLSGSDFNDAQKQELNDLIERNNSVFVGPDGKLGKCNILPHKIQIDKAHRPIRQRYYQLGPQQKHALEGIIADMEKQDVIQRSTSPWGSLVSLCVNQITKVTALSLITGVSTS